MKSRNLLFYLFFLLQTPVFAQHTHELGIMWMNDLDGHNTYAPGVVVQWVKGLGRFTSVETGLGYKVYATTYYAPDVNDKIIPADLITHNIIVPARFRFGHKWLRIQAGGDVAFYLSHTVKPQLSPTIDLGLNAQNITIHPVVGICTPWKLKNNWVIEPGITASSPISIGGVAWGFNLALRKKIR